MRILTLWIGLCWGCTSYEKTEVITFDTGGAPTDTQSSVPVDSGLDTSAPTVDGNAPVIQSCDAWCEEHTTGDTYWKWTLDCQVTDPDGLTNIWNGRFDVLRNNNLVDDGLVACETGTGICTTSFREDTDNILCAQATTYNFVAWIKDWDQHESAPYSVQGRQQ
ncbi:MAG: hypothetical protein VX519_06395 [Myxococcota bacterium]|nr:hypothetical protein [Myxococcota bacterium]